MRTKRKLSDEVGFQLAPMIDMTFLLLIFFMVTSKLSKEQLKVEIKLPTASNAVIPASVSDRDIISIDDAGAYWVGQRAISRQDMAAYLKKRLIDYPPLLLYVRADRLTPGRKIKEFMRMAAEAGAVDVIFASYQN
jgi:biopolymer transport protein ExbD